MNIQLSRSCWLGLGCAGLLLLAAVLLLVDLRADAPGDIDHSAGMVFDPPSKVQSARNKVLYGEWRTDEWTPYIHGALHTVIQTATFQLFGVNMVTMRLPGAIMFGIGLFLCALLAARRSHPFAAFVALALGVINPITIAYGRSGLLEPQLIGWVLLSAWAFDRAWTAEGRRTGAGRSWLALSGVAAGAAFWTKGMGTYYLVPAVIMAICVPPGRRRDAVYFLVPVVLALGLYFGPFMLANQVFFEREADYWLERAQHAGYWAMWSRQPVFHQLGPARWILALGLLAIPFTWRTYQPRHAIPAALRILGVTLLIGLQVTAFMQYRPLRYSIMVVVLSIPLAAWLVGITLQWARAPTERRLTPASRCRQWFVAGLFFLLLGYVINFCVVYPAASAWRDHLTIPLHWRLIGSLACAALLTVGFVWGKQALVTLFSRHTLTTRWIMIGICWGALFMPMLVHHARAIRIYALSREHQMYRFSRLLGEHYRDMMFAGTSPAFGGMENRHRPRKVTHYGINHTVMRDPALSHLLIPDAWGQPAYFRDTFPDVWARSRPVERIVISGFSHTLYALDRQPPRITTDPDLDDEPVVQNPDRHNPAYVTVLANGADTSGSRARLLATDHAVILPAGRWRPALPPPYKLIDRSAWQPVGPHVDQQRLISVPDPHAWELRSLRIGSWASRRTLKPGHARWALQHRNPIESLCIRMRGDPNRIGEVTGKWITSDGATAEWTVPGNALQADAFTPVGIALPTHTQAARGTLQLSVEGHSPLWVDNVLLLPDRAP